MTEAYPLQWPPGRPRTTRPQRAVFKTSFTQARDMLREELRLLGATNFVLSTNVPLNKDGLPYARHKTPDDKGVAAYFTYKGEQMCFACDRWDEIKDNVQAIRKTIEALRGIARWGTGDMMQAAFAGFTALPAPAPAKRQWWEVLGVEEGADIFACETAYRAKARKAHPDNGGTDDEMAELNNAIRRAREIHQKVEKP